ncbi:MAG TPA: hypothetical protein VL282_14685, partial [Tepidisphaeraceae bacterium]|nr:hypothetical protein [Tepidisphaeraceae bacterium]
MPEAQLRLRQSHQCPCLRVVGIEAKRLLAHADNRFLPAYVTETALGPLLPSHQIEIVGLDARCAARFYGFLFGREQLHPQRRDNRFRDLVLDGEDVRQVAVEAIGPDVAAGGAVDELRGDPHSVARLANASFKDV